VHVYRMSMGCGDGWSMNAHRTRCRSHSLQLIALLIYDLKRASSGGSVSVSVAAYFQVLGREKHSYVDSMYK